MSINSTYLQYEPWTVLTCEETIAIVRGLMSISLAMTIWLCCPSVLYSFPGSHKSAFCHGALLYILKNHSKRNIYGGTWESLENYKMNLFWCKKILESLYRFFIWQISRKSLQNFLVVTVCVCVHIHIFLFTWSEPRGQEMIHIFLFYILALGKEKVQLLCLGNLVFRIKRWQ